MAVNVLTVNSMLLHCDHGKKCTVIFFSCCTFLCVGIRVTVFCSRAVYQHTQCEHYR